MDEQEVKERNVYSIIGEDGFERLSKAFYRYCVTSTLMNIELLYIYICLCTVS